ncbi:MAG: hypothetical protein AABW51_04265 [Nanoarchaeota archaeon]
MERNKIVISAVVVGIILLGLVLASPPGWKSGSDTTNYTTIEDSTYYHNFSANITNFNNDVTFAINTVDNNITLTNSSGTYNISDSSIISRWISITNSATGNLTINATYDNQTGFFSVPIQATNTSAGGGSTTVSFEFIINATNDAPNFTNINTTYNFSTASPLSSYLNASDEESHYPLNFTVTFNSTSCTHAAWSNYSNNQNCSLFDLGFNITSLDNISALINMTPTSNDVGVYYANISVRDDGSNYSCPHAYCDNATYKVNKTTYYSSTVTFNVLASLSINVTDCQNKIFQENQYGACNVTIRTKNPSDTLNISSYANLRNYATGQSGVSNTSWFYANMTNSSTNFQYNATINVTPQKTEVGNWTINFTVSDSNGDSSTQQIYVYVNRTINATPSIASISNVNTSINLLTVINLSVYDNDTLVPDKNSSYGGFNETINFTRTILNSSNLAQELSLSNFSITILQMPVAGTNRTSAEIRFTPNSSDSGSYTINITAKDSYNFSTYTIFNLTIINNSAPTWNSPLNTTIVILENSNLYLNLSSNVTDADGNTLTFSFANDTRFDNFNLTSGGIINFTGLDVDIGQHIVNITISDGYLTNTTSFNLTILNINDAPNIQNLSLKNSSGNVFPYFEGDVSNFGSMNATEDNYTTIILWIHDDDVKIPSGQRSFYNESFSVNLTIQGINTSLFNFSLSGIDWSTTVPNRTDYRAIFTPLKASVGNYNITINITDSSNSSNLFSFNLSVLAINHNPVLSNLSNQSSAVNRSFYYDMNVTDTEDGNDTSVTNTNFTFSYSFLSDGSTVSFLNSTYFNSTTGIINLTFNSSQDGKYRLNITVNDSSGAVNYGNFWVNVYGPPNVSSPGTNYVFNLTENTTSILNFTVNHFVGDNLTYDFYVDGINCPLSSNSNCNYTSSLLRDNLSYYGNGTSYNWSFTPNMTDETYNLLKNLTLVVYPSNSNLTNASLLNTTIIFKLNITHTNYNVSFSGHIADLGPTTYGTAITLDLSPYFTDLDYNDPYYAQSPTFTVSSNTSSITPINGASFPGFTLTLSASTAVAGLISLNGSDGSSTASSNSFVVTFVAPTATSSSSTSSGGGSTEVPVSLKIIMPGPISTFQKDQIEVPLTLYNTGSTTLYMINLAGSVAKDNVLVNDVNISFSKREFVSLQPGQKENITMTLDVDTQKIGTFEITVNATSNSPRYSDWGKIFLTIKEGENVGEKIVFTEEFIASNPECIEIKELVDEAKRYAAQGNTALANQKADQALSACKAAIGQAGKPVLSKLVENKLYRYLAVSTAAVFVVGVAFYSYKRIKLRRKKGMYLQESIKNDRTYNNYNRGVSHYG